jgi:predicted nucleic acid-binding Zn ribbon protein
MPEPDVFSTLVAAWPGIVGEQLAPHTSVRMLQDGVCTVVADGPGWATQLRYAERQLVERAAQRCGPGVVTSFRAVLRSD